MKTASGKRLRNQGLYVHATSPEHYLDQRLDKTGDCWVWTGGKDRDGYGQCQSTKYGRELKVSRAHQMAYVTWKDSIPSDAIICHKCDNPSCCNPDHLYAGTWKDNVRDCIDRGRYRNGAKKHKNYDKVVSFKGKFPGTKVAELCEMSSSNVYVIWRQHYGNQNK